MPATDDISLSDLQREFIVLQTRFDTILPTLPTKTDISDLRAEMRGLIADFRLENSRSTVKTQRWLIGTIVAIMLSKAATLFAAVTLLRQG